MLQDHPCIMSINTAWFLLYVMLSDVLDYRGTFVTCHSHTVEADILLGLAIFLSLYPFFLDLEILRPHFHLYNVGVVQRMHILHALPLNCM